METKKIKLKRWHTLGSIAECSFMNNDEFEAISNNRDTPDLVYNTDKDELYYNSFTCCNSYLYGGTCRCINHNIKRWDKFTNQILEILE